MSTPLQEKAAAARANLDKQNPTVAPGKSSGERKRIPLSVPQRKLEVPDLPGYHLRWLRGTAARLAQAERAGYEYVHPDEVQLNNVSVGGDAAKDGNTDMGSRVSIIEGTETENGQAIRMYLMKQKMEYYLEDKKIVQERNDSVADALSAAYTHGQVGANAAGAPPENAEDRAARYVDPKRTRIPDLFNRNKRRR